MAEFSPRLCFHFEGLKRRLVSGRRQQPILSVRTLLNYNLPSQVTNKSEDSEVDLKGLSNSGGLESNSSLETRVTLLDRSAPVVTHLR